VDHLRHFNEGYKVFSLTLPNALTFCNEPVPMDRIDVRERLDYRYAEPRFAPPQRLTCNLPSGRASL
jgi:hypothetical protein